MAFTGLPSDAAADDNAPSAVIKALLDSQVSCWNKKDLDGFLEPYWHDPHVVFQSGGTRSDGFEALRRRGVFKYTPGQSAVSMLDLLASVDALRGRTGFGKAA